MKLLNPKQQRQPPQHGGRLQSAAANSNIALHDWLDLSTGINPEPWPAPPLGMKLVQRLPENEQRLLDAARGYYLGQTSVNTDIAMTAMPGTQWFIQTFPRIAANLVPKQTLTVQIPVVGYQEHGYWWQYHQHHLETYAESSLMHLLAQQVYGDVMVLINPNNPTASMLPNQLIHQTALQNSNTLFIIDEAFMDTTEANSMLQLPLPDNVIVLRSLGKFFGLAGLRVGFCFANNTIINRLTQELGPWAISTPSEWLATQALGDTNWQYTACKNLKALSDALKQLLSEELNRSLPALNSSHYFVTLTFASRELAVNFYKRLQAQGVLTRYIEDSALVRIGLPDWHGLETLRQRLRDAHR